MPVTELATSVDVTRTGGGAVIDGGADIVVADTGQTGKNGEGCGNQYDQRESAGEVSEGRGTTTPRFRRR